MKSTKRWSRKKVFRQQQQHRLPIPLFVSCAVPANIEKGKLKTVREIKARENYIQVVWETACEKCYYDSHFRSIIKNLGCRVCGKYLVTALRYIPSLEPETEQGEQLARDICRSKLECICRLNDMVTDILYFLENDNGATTTAITTEKITTCPKYALELAEQLMPPFKAITFGGCCSSSCREFLSRHAL